MGDIGEAAQVSFLRELHAPLRQLVDGLGERLQFHSAEVNLLQPDTAMAMGGAFGAISKACALLGRDIDNAKAAGPAPDPAELAAATLAARLQRGTRLLLVFKGFQQINKYVWEGQVLEVSPDGLWLKLLDQMRRTTWLRYDSLDIVQVLGMADLVRVDVAPEDSDHD